MRVVLSAVLAFVVTVSLAVPPSALAARAKAASGADVFLLRGFAGVFSRGLDQIGKDLNRRGVKARVLPHSAWRRVTEIIIDNRHRYGRRPVVLIGHSIGANVALKIATALKRKRIKVDLLATFAATNVIRVPSNVGMVTNYYFETNGWGVPLQPGPGFSGKLSNFDFSNDRAVGHFNIEKQPKLQRRVIRDVLRYVSPKMGAKERNRLGL